jgi:hypothetical protein
MQCGIPTVNKICPCSINLGVDNGAAWTKGGGADKLAAQTKAQRGRVEIDFGTNLGLCLLAVLNL